jgi:predicted ABC-type transport system involved in lysophospholipase L1 biosynthesis ATPase subunit
LRDRLRLPRFGQRGTAGASIPAELAFDHVVQTYGGVRALDGVTLAIAPGELVCLLGHSGCGKTTLLRIAAGVEQPAGGRVLLDGRMVSGDGVFLPPERRGVGLMFQDYALFPHLSILENVTFGLRGLPAADAEIAARRALSRVGLERYAADYPHMLSGGEQQRVGPCALHRPATRRAAHGRALLQPRPASARLGPRRDGGDLEGDGGHDHRGDPRSRGGHAHRRPDRAHARRLGGSGGAGRGSLPPSRRSVRRTLLLRFQRGGGRVP